MTERLDITIDTPEVRRLYEMQRSAYAVEAELIGFDGIPPLRETYEDFRACGETFLVSRENGELAGAVAYERNGHELEICRLVVDPCHFRRGVASRLLAALLEREHDWAVARTSTGTANAPAVALYRKLGFAETGRREVAPGVSVTLFALRR